MRMLRWPAVSEAKAVEPELGLTNKMDNPNRPCDLCSLPVGAAPFTLAAGDKTLEFCCNGCKQIYFLLHQINGAAAPDNDNNDAKS